MHIEHLAIWVSDLEVMKTFYEHYFEAKTGEKYYNPSKKFTSYFLSFSVGARLELMPQATIPKCLDNCSPPQQSKSLLLFMEQSIKKYKLFIFS